MTTDANAPWKKKKPARGTRTTLSDEAKAAAKARAAAAGRRYPNLIDNMWAAKWQAARSLSSSRTESR